MIENCTGNLKELSNVLHHMSNEEYSRKLDILGGSSIGQHYRHIIEFYFSLLMREDPSFVNYDNRKREREIEEKREKAIECINSIHNKLEGILEDIELDLIGNFGDSSGEQVKLKTSLFRELAYNLEHSVHHQAIIRIGINSLGKPTLVSDSFGVAAATIRYQSGA